MKNKFYILLVILLVNNFFCSAYFVSAQTIEHIPFIILNKKTLTLNIGENFQLIAVTGYGNKITFKSSNSKVASVNTYGFITAKKPGTAIIIAKVKGAESSCQVKVNKTIITLDKTYVSLEHNEIVSLQASASNGSEITWKSSKKSVAIVEDGVITGLKPGEAIITAKADGTEKNCRVLVRQPKITIYNKKLVLSCGESKQIQVTVSSKIIPTFRSSRSSIAIVDENGVVTAVKSGTARISVKVDNITKFCEIEVKK